MENTQQPATEPQISLESELLKLREENKKLRKDLDIYETNLHAQIKRAGELEWLIKDYCKIIAIQVEKITAFEQIKNAMKKANDGVHAYFKK